MNAIVLLGPPGAGKGTVAEALVEKGFTHVSTGQMLRKEIRLRTPIGIEAKRVIDGGCFVPDDVVIGMVRELLENSAADQKFIFDGFPRNLEQARKLDELFETIEGCLTDVVLLDCPDSVVIERLSGRRTCLSCGQVYHVTYNPPSKEEVCDRDGCDLEQRPDDKEETIQKRLDIYAGHTEPLIRYYEDKALVRRIDASRSIEMVRQAAVEILG
jgi:adenylate kinase